MLRLLPISRGAPYKHPLHEKEPSGSRKKRQTPSLYFEARPPSSGFISLRTKLLAAPAAHFNKESQARLWLRSRQPGLVSSAIQRSGAPCWKRQHRLRITIWLLVKHFPSSSTSQLEFPFTAKLAPRVSCPPLFSSHHFLGLRSNCFFFAQRCCGAHEENKLLIFYLPIFYFFSLHSLDIFLFNVVMK